MPEVKLNENILEDGYPVYYDYAYVADDKVIRSDIQGTVADLKRIYKYKEIKNCDIINRCLMKKYAKEN
jgi:hypothetical protein